MVAPRAGGPQARLQPRSLRTRCALCSRHPLRRLVRGPQAARGHHESHWYGDRGCDHAPGLSKAARRRPRTGADRPSQRTPGGQRGQARAPYCRHRAPRVMVSTAGGCPWRPYVPYPLKTGRPTRWKVYCVGAGGKRQCRSLRGTRREAPHWVQEQETPAHAALKPRLIEAHTPVYGEIHSADPGKCSAPGSQPGTLGRLAATTPHRADRAWDPSSSDDHQSPHHVAFSARACGG